MCTVHAMSSSSPPVKWWQNCHQHSSYSKPEAFENQLGARRGTAGLGKMEEKDTEQWFLFAIFPKVGTPFPKPDWIPFPTITIWDGESRREKQRKEEEEITERWMAKQKSESKSSQRERKWAQSPGLLFLCCWMTGESAQRSAKWEDHPLTPQQTDGKSGRATGRKDIFTESNSRWERMKRGHRLSFSTPHAFSWGRRRRRLAWPLRTRADNKPSAQRQPVITAQLGTNRSPPAWQN